MFEQLTEKFDLFLKNLKGHGKLSEKNIEEVSQKLKLTLLEADVHYQVVKDITEAIRSQAIGQKVHESLTPAQHYIKIVREELVRLLGSQTAEIDFRVKPPLVIFMVGLQGVGKTTTCGKLAYYLTHEKNRNVMLVSTDVRRMAAREQLGILADHVKTAISDTNHLTHPVEIYKAAYDQCIQRGKDTLIVDTSGRMHLDHDLMDEVQRLKDEICPNEILLVSDAMVGQQALSIAKQFHEKLQLTGIILSKMDGDARGGAALSMKKITSVPIKFIGVGEKIEALELFHPERMVSRILQMGDVLTLIEKAQKTYDEGKSQVLQKKLQKGIFSLQDFKEELQQMKKLGGFSSVMKLLPGGNKLLNRVPSNLNMEAETKQMMAIIDSMTSQERWNVEILNGSRRLRIARGSGTEVAQVNRLVKQFLETKKMMKKISKFGKSNPLDLWGRGGT
ncbi:MAG: signal recognition particle protein [Deltaproteobacteria bacterium]|nr:signal recognition particle protein [Deltaproteobacteria bacterium]